MAAEEFDEECARDVEAFGHLGVHLGIEAHLLAGDVLQLLADGLGRDDEHRQHDEGQQRQAPFEEHHRAEGRDENDHVADDAAERAGDSGLRADHVVVESADQRTGLGAGEEADRHPLHLVEQGDAQVVDESFTDACRVPALGDRQAGIGQRRSHGDGGEHPDHAAVLVGDRHVEDLTDDEERHQGDEGRQQDRQQEPDDAALVRTGERPHPAQRTAPSRLPRTASASLRIIM